MQSPEYGEILTSLQEIVRKAYVLGRSEALKQVIDVMQKDETSWKPLALTGPAEGAPPASVASIEAPSSEPGPQTDAPADAGAGAAWWAKGARKPPARPARAARPF